MKILQKYLIGEITKTSIAVLAIFLVILTANTMLRLIEETSVGNFPTYLLFPLIIIKITQYSIYLIPISLFLGVILSFGRFYSGNEMAVINSSGISAYDISGIIARVVFPAALIVALFSLYVTPSATQYRYKIEHKLSSEERIEEINPGRFTSSQSGSATFFVENINNNTLERIFFSSSGGRAEAIESSSTARYIKDKDNRRYILLRDGVISEIIPPDYTTTRKTSYREHGVQLGQAIPEFINTKYDAISTLTLLSIGNRESNAELQSRLLLPIATVLLGFIAFPVSYSSPRKGRYAKVFLGSLIYFSYLIMMSIVEKLYLLGTTPPIFGMWWFHFLMLILILYVYKNDMKTIPSRT